MKMKIRRTAEVTISKDDIEVIDNIMREFYNNFGDDIDFHCLGAFLYAIYLRDTTTDISPNDEDDTHVNIIYEEK